MHMHAFIGVNFFPRGKSGGEGPTLNSKADPVKERNLWVIRAPEGVKEGVKVPWWGGRE